MATCKNCGKPLILSGGKCIYCGWVPNQESKADSGQDAGRRSRPIIQRKTMGTRDGQSPYSQYSGQSIIPGAKTDRFGNPQGSQYDLAKDGAFKGYKIVVLGWDEIMKSPRYALEKKGFEVEVLNIYLPLEQKKFQELLDNDRSQLWIISSSSSALSQAYYEMVYDHFNKGRGLYVWSDNDPLFADSNVILSHLFGTRMSGEYMADKVLTIQQSPQSPGIIANHPITTGIQNFYEGVTISNVKLIQGLKPLVYSSDGLIVTAYYDLGGKRCLVDGGWTRLYYKWDSAGTDRFVVNCAAWLTNIERFGYHPDK